MDLNRKSEIAVMAVRSITEHTDEPVEARLAALEAASELIDRLKMRGVEKKAQGFWARIVAFFKRGK